MQILEAGTKIEYLYGGEWKIGIVHGYRQYENELGLIQMVTYLIDTGENERVDEYPVNLRDQEYGRQLHELLQKGASVEEAHKIVTDKNDLPDSKIEVEKVRQPKQIELSQDFVKPLN